MKNPEYLTKDQLKEELLAHGIELPTGRVLKAQYVDLYNMYINQNYEQTNTIHRTNAAKRSSQVQKELNLEELTNTEVAARLRSLGHSVGPITTTTRKVYIKKLSKLLESGDASENHEESDEEDDEDEDEPPVTRSVSKRRSVMPTQETRPVVPTPVVSIRKSTSGIRQRQLRVDVIDDVAPTQEEETEELIEVTEESQNTTGTVTDTSTTEEKVKQKANKPERRWIPIWLQIAFTIVVVLFAYLVIQAMEKNPSPLSLPKGKGSL